MLTLAFVSLPFFSLALGSGDNKLLNQMDPSGVSCSPEATWGGSNSKKRINVRESCPAKKQLSQRRECWSRAGTRDATQAGKRDTGMRGWEMRGWGMRDTGYRDARMRRCGDARIWGCGMQDAGMRRCGDAGMRDAEMRDADMRGCGMGDGGKRG